MAAQILITSPSLVCQLRLQYSLLSDTTTMTKCCGGQFLHLASTVGHLQCVLWPTVTGAKVDGLRGVWQETSQRGLEECCPLSNISVVMRLTTGARHITLAGCQTSGLKTKQQSYSNQRKYNKQIFSMPTTCTQTAAVRQIFKSYSSPHIPLLCSRCLMLY